MAREVESLIALRNPSGYERAVALLIGLRDLAGERGGLDEFGRRLGELRRRHERKERLLERLGAAALDR